MKAAGTGGGGGRVAGDKHGAGGVNHNGAGGGEEGNGAGSTTTGGGGAESGTDASTGTASHEPPNRQQADGSEKQQQQTAAAQKPPLPPPMTSAKGGGGGEQQQQEVVTKEKKLPAESDSGDPDDQEEDEILEESPCKRWSKRREKVKQRDVPGIDAAYLAMDNETGNEVVWNEVLFSERKNFREQEEKIRSVFDHLTRLEHPYLVKFHKYWMDTKSEKPRIIFITEYMSSGPMSRFLQKARSSGTLLNIKAWKNWIRQILSALSYLHACDPPIVHGNLTCNTMFIQHNGLVKIGCVAPNTIHHHVKTYRENIKNVHYLAPEYEHLTEITTQADIYSFGVCALEMATTGALQSGSLNGGSGGNSMAGPSEKASSAPPAIEGGSNSSAQTPVAGGSHIITEEVLRKAVDSLEDPEQKEFINRCLEKDPNIRANAAELLNRLGPAEPEKDETSLDEDGFMEENRQQKHEQTPTPMAAAAAADRATSPPQEAATNMESGGGGTTSNSSTIQHHQQQSQQNQTTGNPSGQQQQQTVTTTTVAPQQDGYHTQCTVTTTITTHASAAATTTTTAIAHPTSAHLQTAQQQQSCQLSNQQQQQLLLQHQTAPDEGYHTTQSIVDAPTGTSTPLSAEMSILPTSGVPVGHRETRQILQMQAEMLDSRQLRVQLQLDDQMNRQLTALLRDEDTPEALVAELVQHGFVSEANSPKMRELLAAVLSEHRRRELEMAARREFGDSGQRQQSAAASTASSAHSSAHQSPKHQSMPPQSSSS